MPSAIETVLDWHCEVEYSDRCAYILAMINYRNNPLTDVGRDPNASIVKDEDEKLYPLAYAAGQEKPYVGGIRWLIQNRHANIHQKDHNGWDLLDCCIGSIHSIIEDYKEYLEQCSSITDAINYKKAEFTSLKKAMFAQVAVWISTNINKIP